MTLDSLARALEGDHEGALQLITPDLERWARKDFEYSLLTAQTLSFIGETERAVPWLENSVERGNCNYPYLSGHDPFLAPLRGNERFRRIADRAGAGWERWHTEHQHPPSGRFVAGLGPSPTGPESRA